MRRDQELVTRFGQNLRRARLERGMTQADLARESGLTVTDVGRIERGTREIRLGTLARLLHGLGAAPEELLSALRLPPEEP